MALACEVSGLTPKELLALEDREQQLLIQSACELENWRWDNWNNLIRALAKSLSSK